MRVRPITGNLLTLFLVVTFVGLVGSTLIANAGTPPASTPSTPTNVVAKAGDGRVSVSWTAVSGASSYHLTRATSSSGPFVQIAAPVSTGHVDSGLTNGKVYFYKVAAVNSAGTGPSSAMISAIPAASSGVPAVPRNVYIIVGNGQLTIGWTASAGATKYHLKRSTVADGVYKQIAAPVTTSHLDTPLVNGAVYYYKVSAVNSSGESSNTSAVNSSPTSNSTSKAPPIPSGLIATPGNGKITVTWSPSSGATHYHLKRATVSGGPYTQIAAPVSTGHTDSPVANGTTYYYVVTALDSDAESGHSLQISAKASATTSGSGITSVTVSPSSASVEEKTTLQLTASVAGTASNKSITWKTSYGTISSSGVFTAPSGTGTATITATSQADSSKSDTATINVTAAATAEATTTTGGLPSSFFGQTWNSVSASHVPSVSFGTMRLWDTGTSWAEMEPSRGNYNWVDFDTWLDIAGREGKTVLLTFGRTPQWLSSNPTQICAHGYTGCAAPPTDVDSGDTTWKNFVTAVVKRSLSNSIHVKYYQVWNEPNDIKTWSGTYQQLATMAKDAYNIIHTLDSNALVVGPAPTGSNTVEWLQNYYNAGALHAQDVVALHTYITAKTDTAALAARVDQLRTMMANNGLSGKQIWSTEGGWGLVSETTSNQAAILAQLYVQLWSKEVNRFYWYSWDNIHDWGTMWTPDGGINSVGVAYGVLGRWLIGSKHSTNPCSKASDGTWTCKLVLSNGYGAEIIWNPTTSEYHTVSSSYTTFETLNSNNLHSISNHQVYIGPQPILAIAGQLAP